MSVLQQNIIIQQAENYHTYIKTILLKTNTLKKIICKVILTIAEVLFSISAFGLDFILLCVFHNSH